MSNRLDKFTEALKRFPMTEGFVEQIAKLRERYGDEYEETANEILRLLELLNLDSVKIGRKYIYDYLKQLDYFLKYGSYGHSDFNEIRQKIYDDEKTMLETYMPGLLISYAYTTILYEKNHLFVTEFLPRLTPGMKGIEVGFGEGFYLWELLKRHPKIRVTGFDISPHAIAFASRLLNVAGISPECFDLRYGNLLEGLEQPDESVDFATLAEVIEHIPEPQAGIREIVRTLKKDGLLYLTTVIDSNHMDHISNFQSPAEVENMIHAEGLTIMAKRIYYNKNDFPDSSDISVGLAYVLFKGAERKEIW